MEIIPVLKIGWLNGWILLAFEFLVEGSLMLVFPKDVVSRLFDRSGWSEEQRVLLIAGKLFSVACLVFIILTPLKISSSEFILGLILYGIGLAGFVAALLTFKVTPLNQPVTKGLYRLSRHPQVVSSFLIILGICVAIGSWEALFLLVMSRLFQHFGILAEEKACLKAYGEPYRAYLERVPRYFLFL
jgi:protein-S-isoprenylcysteine O-methyltransferase Ste14